MDKYAELVREVERLKALCNNLESRIDSRVEDTVKLRASHVALEGEVASLNDRLGDEVNHGHALYRRVEAQSQKIKVLEEQMPGLHAADQNLERKVNACLGMDDLRKLNTTISLMEKDIEKLFDPQAFGPEQRTTQADVVKALQSAKQRVATHQDRSAVSAITYCTLPGDLRSRAFLAMYLSVSAIWGLTPEAPAVLTDNVICQLLHEWHDGMVTHKEDVLLAFDVAIKKETLRV